MLVLPTHHTSQLPRRGRLNTYTLVSVLCTLTLRHFRLLARRPGTHSRIVSGIQRAAQTVLSIYLKCTCSRDTSAYSAVGVLNDYALHKSMHSLTHTHTHMFNSPFSGTTQVSRCQNGKTNLDFTKARDSEWMELTDKPTNCNECWMRPSKWSVARGNSTVVWRIYYMPIFTGLTCLSVTSVKYKLCMMLRWCQDGTALQCLAVHWAPVSVTASWHHLRSSAGHQLTYTSSGSHMVVGRLLSSARRRGTHCRNALLFLAVHSKHSSSQSNLSNWVTPTLVLVSTP